MRLKTKTPLIIMILTILTIQIPFTYATDQDIISQSLLNRQIHVIADNPAFVNKVVSSSGFQPISLKNTPILDNFTGLQTLVIQGETITFTDDELSRLMNFVNSGGHLAIWGNTPLAQTFDFEFESTYSYTQAKELKNMAIDIFWPAPITAKPLENTGDLSVFTIFNPTNDIAVAGKSYGEGKVIYAVDPVYESASHDFLLYPYLMKHVGDYFNLKSSIRIDDIRVYMDWGFHFDQNPEAIVQTLLHAGVSEVHLSAWYEIERVKSFFDAFIAQCHANGIRVYAWLELPMVTQEFWDENPQARQKLINGEDAVIGWRALVAMEDPQVNDLVKDKVDELVGAFDYDGANIAELYFEPAGGLELVNDITPFSDYFVDSFIKKHGRKPQDIFTQNNNLSQEERAVLLNAFIDERKRIITDLNVEYVNFIKTEYPDLDIYVTVIDDALNTNIPAFIGSDSVRIMKAIKDPSVKLQIEDPFNLWDVGSSRYIQIGDAYSKTLPDNFESIDINIVNRPYAFPTLKQTGSEYDLVLFDGSKKRLNVQLYALNTVDPIDLLHAPYVLGSHIEVKQLGETFIFDAPAPFYFEGDFNNIDVFIDKKLWPFHDENTIWIPKGQSLVTLTPITNDSHRLLPFITKFTGQFTDYNVQNNTLSLTYSSDRKDYISTNTYMDIAVIDQATFEPQAFFNGHVFTYCLPPGDHTVTFIHTKDPQNLIANNGQIISFKSQLLEKNDELLIPARAFFEHIGAKFDLHESFKTLSATYKNYALWIQADNRTALANGSNVILDVPAQIIDGVFYIPFSFVAEAFAYDITDMDGVYMIQSY